MDRWAVKFTNILRAAFCTKVFCTASICLRFWLEIGAKAVRKMLVKLTASPTKHFYMHVKENLSTLFCHWVWKLNSNCIFFKRYIVLSSASRIEKQVKTKIGRIDSKIFDRRWKNFTWIIINLIDKNFSNLYYQPLKCCNFFLIICWQFVMLYQNKVEFNKPPKFTPLRWNWKL